MRRLTQPTVLLFIITLATLIRFDRPLVRGDGVAYLAWTDTLVIDHDADLTNQAEKFEHINTAGQIVFDWERNQWVSVFPFGIAIVQAPFYATGHLFAEQNWLMLNTDYFMEMQGVPLPYSFWVMIGANVMALIAVFCAYHLGKRFTDPMTAALTAYVVFIGTPLIYYSTISPMHSHNSGAFTFAVFLYLLGKISFDNGINNGERWYIWTLLGIFAGLTVMIRWQVLLSIIPAWALLAYERYFLEKHRWQSIAIATIAAAITLLPLPIIFHELYGEWIVIPYNSANDAQFLHNPLKDMFNVAIATIKHSPIILLSVAGVGLMIYGRIPMRPYKKQSSVGMVREPSAKTQPSQNMNVERQVPSPRRRGDLGVRWPLMLAAMILLQLIINGAALDWWGGESYGIRRMTEIYAVYALLACGAVGAIITWSKQYIRKYAPMLVRAALLLFAAYTFLYVIAFIHFTWTHPSNEFNDDPLVMIDFLIDRDRVFRWQIIDTLFEEHVGPPAWDKPNP